MHILFFVDFHDSTIGGVQTSIRSQKRALEQAGHLVTVVSPSPLDSNLPDSSTSILLPNVPFVYPNGFPLVTPSKKNFNYLEEQSKKLLPIDIVHIQSNIGVGILGYKFAKKYNLPSVQTMHGRDDVLVEKIYRFPVVTSWLANYVHARHVPHRTRVIGNNVPRAARYTWEVMINQAEVADWVTVPSTHFKQKFIARGLTNDISVISNGLSDEVVTRASQFTRTHSVAGTRIMWCGRFSPEKRPLEMLEAIARCDDTVHLDMYGSGAYTAQVKQYIKELGIQKKVSVFTDANQKTVLEEMATHDVLVYNSYGFDNQPMVLLEALLSQLPVILCDPDLEECVPIGSSLLTRDPSSAAIADAIQQFMAAPAEANRMRAIMQRHASDVYQKTHTKKMLALYGKLLSRRSQSV